MKKSQRSLQRDDSTEKPVLYMAFELSNAKWKLAFSDSKKIGFATIDSRNLLQLQEAIRKAKLHFSLSNEVRIVSCCEAGRDGFWLQRYLVRYGIKNIVVDLSSIKINLRKQQAKTVRIDAGKLLRMLIRYYGGEKNVLSVVRVPSVEDEDGRHFNQELEGLKKEQTMHRNRIRGFFLIQQGLKELSGDKRFGFLAVIIFLLIFTGYLLLNLKLQNSPRWGFEDIAPQKYESPSLKAKESFVPGFTDEKKVKKELPIVEKFDNRIIAGKDIQAATQVKVGNQKDDFSEKQEIRLIPDRKIVVYFKHESNELPNHAFKTLDQIVKFSAHYPESEIVVEGYTDSFGKYFYNKKLSKFRADVVKKYLVSQGISATKIKTFGMGSEKPIKSNETVEGRKQNRRVEIKLNKK
jgi:transposase